MRSCSVFHIEQKMEFEKFNPNKAGLFEGIFFPGGKGGGSV